MAVGSCIDLPSPLAHEATNGADFGHVDEELFKKFDMEGLKEIYHPIAPGTKLDVDELSSSTNETKYKGIIGSFFISQQVDKILYTMWDCVLDFSPSQRNPI